MAKLDWLRRPIAHRGLHDAKRGVIENTTSAIEAAIAKDFAIEVDLQEAGDGTPMVFHDATLERLTKSRGALAKRSAKQLGRISLKDSSDRMQTLRELFDQVDGRVPLVLEIKSDWRERESFGRRIAENVSTYRGPAAVMSFDPVMVAAIRNANAQITRGLVAERFQDEHYWQRLSAIRRFKMRHLFHARFALPQFIAYDVNGLPALAPWLGRHVFGLPLLTWTVRTSAQRERAERWADAMIFEGFEP